MRKVASRSELSALLKEPTKPPDPKELELATIARQVSDVTRAVGQLAAAVHAHATAQSEAKAKALEAVIHRDDKGVAQKITITRR